MGNIVKMASWTLVTPSSLPNPFLPQGRNGAESIPNTRILAPTGHDRAHQPTQNEREPKKVKQSPLSGRSAIDKTQKPQAIPIPIVVWVVLGWEFRILNSQESDDLPCTHVLAWLPGPPFPPNMSSARVVLGPEPTPKWGCLTILLRFAERRENEPTARLIPAGESNFEEEVS